MSDSPKKRKLDPKDVEQIKAVMAGRTPTADKPNQPSCSKKHVYFDTLSKRLNTVTNEGGDQQFVDSTSKKLNLSTDMSQKQAPSHSKDVSMQSRGMSNPPINPSALKEKLRAHLATEPLKQSCCDTTKQFCRCRKIPSPQAMSRLISMRPSSPVCLAGPEKIATAACIKPTQQALDYPNRLSSLDKGGVNSLKQRLAASGPFSGDCVQNVCFGLREEKFNVSNLFVSGKEPMSSENISQMNDNSAGVPKPQEVICYRSKSQVEIQVDFKTYTKEKTGTEERTTQDNSKLSVETSDRNRSLASSTLIECPAAVRRYPMSSMKNLEEDLSKGDGQKGIDDFKMGKQLEKQKMYEDIMREELLRREVEDRKRMRMFETKSNLIPPYSPWAATAPKQGNYPFTSCCGACNLYPGVLLVAVAMMVYGSFALLMTQYNAKAFKNHYMNGAPVTTSICLIVFGFCIILGLLLLIASLMDNGAFIMIWFLITCLLAIFAFVIAEVILNNGCKKDYSLNANGGVTGSKVYDDKDYEEFEVDFNLCRGGSNSTSSGLHKNKKKIEANLACSLALLNFAFCIAFFYALWLVASFFYFRFMRRAMFVARAKCKCHSRIYNVKCGCNGP